MANLKTKATRAVIWSAIDKFSEQGIHFVIGIIIARILFPSDYGLIGMIAVFLAIPDVLVNSGFSAALIQKKNVVKTDYSTVFYFNVFSGVLLYFILYLSAPLIANFFNEPQLVLITRVFGIAIIINSFSLVKITILIKNLDFKVQTIISIGSMLPAGIVGIVAAYSGLGVWAIVLQSLCRQFLNSVLLWILNKWRPEIAFSIQSFKSLFSFGSKMLVTGLLNAFFSRIYYVVIGKLFSAESLGYFTKAWQFSTLPPMTLSTIIDRITFPLFSSIQDDNVLLLKGYRKTIVLAAFINFPVMLGLIVISEPLIKLILTEKWLPLVPYLQIMCLGGLLLPMHSLTLNIIKSKGFSGIFLKLDVIKKIITIVAILISYRWGIIGIVIASTVISFPIFYLNFYYTGKSLNFSFRRQLLDLLPYLMLASVMALVMFVSGFLVQDSDLLKILVQIAAGIMTYAMITKILKMEGYSEMLKVKKEIISKLNIKSKN